MINQNFVLLAAAFNLIGSTSYVVATLKGRTKPNRVSWFLWALAPLIAVASMLSQDVGPSTLMTFMVGFGPLLVFIASFVNRNAYWKITSLDIICGVLSLTALLLWYITQVGNVALAMSILADTLATVPTLIKSWREPETEDYRVFFFAIISSIITVMTLTTWDFAHLGFPVYIFLNTLTLTIVIAFPQFRPFSKRRVVSAVPN